MTTPRVTRHMRPRWDYKGKSYGSAMAAYRRAAKDDLWDGALGKNREKMDSIDFGQCARDEYGDYQEGACDALVNALFGKLMREFGFTCEPADYSKGYPESWGCGCAEGRAFCTKKYRAWIERRAKEIMKEEDGNG